MFINLFICDGWWELFEKFIRVFILSFFYHLFCLITLFVTYLHSFHSLSSFLFSFLILSSLLLYFPTSWAFSALNQFKIRFSLSLQILFNSYNNSSTSASLITSPIRSLTYLFPKSYTFSGTHKFSSGMNSLLHEQKCTILPLLSSFTPDILDFLPTFPKCLTPPSYSANFAKFLYSSVASSILSNRFESFL